MPRETIAGLKKELEQTKSAHAATKEVLNKYREALGFTSYYSKDEEALTKARELIAYQNSREGSIPHLVAAKNDEIRDLMRIIQVALRDPSLERASLTDEERHTLRNANKNYPNSNDF